MGMEFPEILTVDGTDYKLVDTQRNKTSAIYGGESVFVRIGEPAKLEKDIAFHKKMESFGFPVAKLLREGEYEGMLYFIEESLGETCFALLFKNEYEQHGEISEATFSQFMDVARKFALAQLTTATHDQNWEEVKRGVQLERICRELPHLRPQLEERYGEIIFRLSSASFVVTHGDFGPFNIFPKGIIDLEDSFMAPLGYDTIPFITHLDWFPDHSDDPYHKLYRFSENQVGEYLAMLRDVYEGQGIEINEQLIADFDFLRGIWFVVGLEKYQNLQSFRYALIETLV